MDQDFSNYLSARKESLAFPEVQSQHPSMVTPSELLFDNHQVDTEFYDLYNYSANRLKSWGLNPGILTSSKQNSKTVNCLMELIRLRQKDLDYRQKVKQDMAKVEYDKELMKSKLNLAVNEMNEYKRKLGQLQNKHKDQEIKFRKDVKSTAAEKQQLAQVRQKLEQKNIQILHEMRRREAEMNKADIQMKKPIQKVQPKNSFQVVDSLSSAQEQECSKCTLLKEKRENERKYYLKENTIMKQQLECAEDAINDFIKFLKENCQRKAFQELRMNPNHPIEYNQGRLLQRLSQALEDIKSSLAQITQQSPKERGSAPLMAKPLNKRMPIEPANKLTQSISTKPTVKKDQEDDDFQKVLKEDISIISHIEVRDIQMPLQGKGSQENWNILDDGQL